MVEKILLTDRVINLKANIIKDESGAFIRFKDVLDQGACILDLRTSSAAKSLKNYLEKAIPYLEAYEKGDEK